MKLHIKNGRVIDPANGIDAQQDLFIAAGKVIAVGAAPDGFHASRFIDATGLVLVPGLVDLSARLREPGYEYNATLESEMQAAMQGGVTSLVCPPDTGSFALASTCASVIAARVLLSNREMFRW